MCCLLIFTINTIKPHRGYTVRFRPNNESHDSVGRFFWGFFFPFQKCFQAL